MNNLYKSLKTQFLIFLFYLLLINISYSQTIKLKFIETSDVHGSLFPWDFINNKPASTSLAQVYSYVEQQRADTSQNVILLDNGDILQGQPLVYYSNFENTESNHICADVMNYMKYDAATVGNHDIEPGHPVYDKLVNEFKFPWLAANAINTKTNEPYFQPYTILTRNGVKIAILGLITPAIPMWLPEKIWSGIEFSDMIESAKKWVPLILEKEQPDVLVGLFHAGVEANYEGQSALLPKNENAAELVAKQVPGFNVVFVGHDHHGWNYKVKNAAGDSVLILGPLNAARTVTEATLELKKSNIPTKWTKQTTGKIIPIESYSPHKAFMTEFDSVIQSVKTYVSKPLGELTNTISSHDAFFGNSPFIDLIQSIQLELTNADVSFASLLSFNAEIRKGPVYVRDMFNLYKFENLLYTMQLSGQEIKDLLEYSYGLWFNHMKNADDNLLNFKKDEYGNLLMSKGNPQLKAAYYNFTSAAGINYTVDVSKPVGERIYIRKMANGDTFCLTKLYTVAINSYQGNGGGGLLTQGAKIPKDQLTGRIINSTPKDLRYYMMKWIEEKKTITPNSLNNWNIIPNDWWLKGKEKDSELLFKK